MNQPAQPLVEARHLTVTFQGRANRLFERAPSIVAVDDVSLTLAPGESLAVVGESGSGKSTLVRALLGLQPVNAGEVLFEGRQVLAKGRERWLRSRTGIVFQDPYSSLNPRRTVGQSVSEPLVALGIDDQEGTKVRAVLERLGLPGDAASRYPREFSGGQRQRIALARALVHSPDLLVGDEPVSALDVLVRGTILELMRELRAELGLTLITVTHDLSIVPDLAEKMLVLKEGKVVEAGLVTDLFERPSEPYTQRLIASIPRL